MNFWENVDDELKFRGMERKELGSLAGFPESYISKGIARQSCPSADLAIKIAHVLKVPVESLVNGFCESDKIPVIIQFFCIVQAFCSLW